MFRKVLATSRTAFRAAAVEERLVFQRKFQQQQQQLRLFSEEAPKVEEKIVREEGNGWEGVRDVVGFLILSVVSGGCEFWCCPSEIIN